MEYNTVCVSIEENLNCIIRGDIHIAEDYDNIYVHTHTYIKSWLSIITVYNVYVYIKMQ